MATPSLYNDSTGSTIYQLAIANTNMSNGLTPPFNSVSTGLTEPSNSLGSAPVSYTIAFVDPKTGAPLAPTGGMFELRYGTGVNQVTTPLINYLPANTLAQRIQNILAPIINGYNGVDHMDPMALPLPLLATGALGIFRHGSGPDDRSLLFTRQFTRQSRQHRLAARPWAKQTDRTEKRP